MNQLAHIFLTYFFLSFIIPETQKYLLPIALFSFIVDFDHTFSYIKMFRMSKNERKKLQIEDYVDLFRTAVQEPIGILTIVLLLGLLYVFGVTHILITIAIFSILLHWIIDFLTVHTRPFVPINDKIVCLFFKTKKQRLWSEIVITTISFVLFLVVYS